MPTSTTRRPLPALAFLLALSVLTAIVWWRVLHRDTGSSATQPTQPTPTPSSTCATHGKPVSFPKPSAVTVQVLNANGQTGLASTVDGQLKALGFRSAGFGDAPANIPTAGELHYGTTGASSAHLLSFYLPGLKLVTIRRADATVDVVIGQAYRGLASTTAVQQALAKAEKPC